MYAVVALQPGRVSAPCRSDPVGSPQPPAPPQQPPAPPVPAQAPEAPPAPQGVTASRVANGSVEVCWTGPTDVEYRVRCQSADGGWRVVGRTRDTMIEDGGAAPGPVPVYAVSAARASGGRSAESRSGC